MTGTDSRAPADVVQQVLDGLRFLHEETGDPCFRRAAAALEWRAGGRPAIDDAQALREVSDMVTTGAARSAAQACARVARTMHGYSADATAARLRRKYRQSIYEQNS